MKVCQWGLENIWINHSSGEVRMCGWTGSEGVIGNLLDNTIEELWHGERAERFRNSMLDGSYRYCNKKECPNCANGIVEKLYVEYEVPEYPKLCSLSYEEQCNYVCRFCRKEKYIPCKEDQVRIKKIEKEILKFLDKLDTVSTNGVGEIFCSNSTIELLKKINTSRNINVVIESNGSLFNEANWEKISNLGKYNLDVYITVHSFKEDTYQFLSGTKLPVSNIINNLRFISSLRKQNIVNYFEIATVVCERNFREMPEYIEYCLQEFQPDKIRLRFFKPYGVRPLAIEWFYDIRNTKHPYHEEYVKVMQNPIFKHEKVWKWQGDTASDLSEHPYFMEKKRADFERKKIDLINYLLTTEDIAERIRVYLKKYEIDCFALYGDTVITKTLINILDHNGMICSDILDSYRSNIYYRGHKIIRPDEDNLRYNAVVITNLTYQHDIKDKLLLLGYKGRIVGIEEMICELEDQSE